MEDPWLKPLVFTELFAGLKPRANPKSKKPLIPKVETANPKSKNRLSPKQNPLIPKVETANPKKQNR
jgi:hypothetical protein